MSSTPGGAVLSFAQQRLWLLDQLIPGSAAYLDSRAYELTGPLDTRALARAVAYVVARHPALRTRIAVRAARPGPVTDPPDTVAFREDDLTDTPDAARRARELAGELCRVPMDLATGPLFRAGLIRVGLGPVRVLLLRPPHRVRRSVAVIVERDLGMAYRAFQAGGTPSAPPVPVRYVDYVARQRAALAGPELAGELDYWRERLAGVPAAVELPTDRPRPPVPTLRGDQIVFRIDLEVHNGLRRIAEDCRTSPLVVALAAYQAQLGFLPAARMYRSACRSPAGPTRISTRSSGSLSTPW